MGPAIGAVAAAIGAVAAAIVAAAVGRTERHVTPLALADAMAEAAVAVASTPSSPRRCPPFSVASNVRAADFVRDAAQTLTAKAEEQTNIEAITSRLEQHGVEWAWQLVALDGADWQKIGASMGVKAAVKAQLTHGLRASQLSSPQRRDTAAEEPAEDGGQPVVRRTVSRHRNLEEARAQSRWGVGLLGWRNVHLSWLQALIDSGQTGASLRAAVASWTDGYTIQWLLFFATVVPVSFDISDKVPSTPNALSAADALQITYCVVTAFTISTMLTGIWMASYTSQVVAAVSDANMAAALAGPVLPMIRQLMLIYQVAGGVSLLWLVLSLHIGFAGEGAPWWFVTLLYVSALLGAVGMFGSLGCCGLVTRGRMDGSVLTTLIAWGGLMSETPVLPPESLSGRSHLDVLDDVACVAMRRRARRRASKAALPRGSRVLWRIGAERSGSEHGDSATATAAAAAATAAARGGVEGGDASVQQHTRPRPRCTLWPRPRAARANAASAAAASEVEEHTQEDDGVVEPGGSESRA